MIPMFVPGSHIIDKQTGIRPNLQNVIPLKEQAIYRAIDCMRDQGHSWRDIHEELMRLGLISKKSWQAFQKWLTRRHLQELYPRME